nr:9018_t:CDS:1 [Entrophospora candida]
MAKILNLLLFFCRSRVFYILVVIIVLCEFLYTFYTNQDLLKQQPPTTSSEISKFVLPQLLLNARQRPRDDFIVKVENVEKNCGSWRKIPIKDCLKYLDIYETNYNLPYDRIEGALKPPSCVNDKDDTDKHEADKIIHIKNGQRETSLSNIMLFHVFWKGDISDKLALMMKAFIYSQPLKCSKLYVWIQADDEQNLTNSERMKLLTSNENMKLLTRFIPHYIELKIWDTKSQLSSIDLFNGWENMFRGKKTVSFSDLVRFVVLYKYGGMYVDADVLLLRDMRPFYHSNFEFSYRWSYLDDYNTAVLRLWKNSATAIAVIKGAMKNHLDFHPFRAKKYLLNDDTTTKELNEKLYMLPVGLFDPLWLRNDGRQNSSLSPNLNRLDQAFEADFVEDEFPGVNLTEKVSPLSLRKMENFFRGSYAYHWHNHWSTVIEPSSWIGVIQTACDQFIEGKRRNLYNEVILPPL